MGNPFFRALWRVLICIRIVTDMQMERLRKKKMVFSVLRKYLTKRRL